MTFDEMLDVFMERWPGMKVGREQVKRELGRALHKATLDEILAGEDRLGEWMKASGTEKRFVKHPAKWLHWGCWTDELEIPRQLTHAEQEEIRQQALARVRARAANGR